MGGKRDLVHRKYCATLMQNRLNRKFSISIAKAQEYQFTGLEPIPADGVTNSPTTTPKEKKTQNNQDF